MIIDESNYKQFIFDDGKTIYCSNKKITEIRYLPEGLDALYCDGNDLTTLPKLPNNLVTLYCRKNKLTSLPELPDSLERLNCFGNRLTSLPELPESLEQLFCVDNILPIQGTYFDKKEISEFKHKMNQYNLINQMLEKL